LKEKEMDPDILMQLIAKHAEAIRTLVQPISDAQARWKPSPEDWSILEVVNHLFDEELEDFRAHLDFVLYHADQPWPEIDPEGWVTERAYNQREIGESLDKFLKAREESLAWLERLETPNWEAAYQLEWGPLTAGDMLASWVAHDLLHMRQLVELQRAYAVQQSEPYSGRYAGQW
jgi:hypothetical protein